METIKRLIIGLVLYVAVPAALLQGLFFVMQSDSDQITSVINFVSEHGGSDIAVTAENAVDEIKTLISSARDDEPIQIRRDGKPRTSPSAETRADQKTVAAITGEDTIQESTLSYYLDDPNKVPVEFADQSFSKDDILNDKLNRVSQDFKVPASLRQRVGFWLDIYTKYSSRFSVVHDADRPWVIYRVVDVREIYNRNINKYQKDALDHKAVALAKTEVRQILTRLARKRDFTRLTEQELKIYKLFDYIPGKKQTLFMAAASNVRDQRGQKDFYRKGVMTSSRYLTEMEEVFARYDLPVELVRLPLVESSFNEDARSKVGASGIWQFMPSMGKHYMEVNDTIDERNSPIKATEAAAKMMLSNFRILHSWPLAVTAYNHGPGGLIRGQKQAKSSALADIILKYRSKSFSFASQNFFCEFLAALHGERYQEEVFGEVPKYPALAAETIDLKFRMRAQTLADIVGVTIEELKLFNPDLKSQAVSARTFIPAGYHIRLPKGRKARLEIFNYRSLEVGSKKPPRTKAS